MAKPRNYTVGARRSSRVSYVCYKKKICFFFLNKVLFVLFLISIFTFTTFIDELVFQWGEILLERGDFALFIRSYYKQTTFGKHLELSSKVEIFLEFYRACCYIEKVTLVKLQAVK